LYFEEKKKVDAICFVGRKTKVGFKLVTTSRKIRSSGATRGHIQKTYYSGKQRVVEGANGEGKPFA